MRYDPSAKLNQKKSVLEEKSLLLFLNSQNLVMKSNPSLLPQAQWDHLHSTMLHKKSNRSVVVATHYHLSMHLILLEVTISWECHTPHKWDQLLTLRWLKCIQAPSKVLSVHIFPTVVSQVILIINSICNNNCNSKWKETKGTEKILTPWGT